MLETGFSTVVQEVNVHIELAQFYADIGKVDEAIGMLAAFRKTFESPRPVKVLLQTLKTNLPKKIALQNLSLLDAVISRIQEEGAETN